MKKKLLIFLILILAAVVVVILMTFADDVREAVWNNQDEAGLASSSAADILGPSKIDETNETTLESISDEDVPIVDEDFLFNPVEPSVETLVKDAENSKTDALTVTFDGLTISPGMKVSEIIDASHWYTLRENDKLASGDASYLILNNDFWTNDEIQLNNEAAARNGEIILWVHNYSDNPAPLRDCVIYKYKINYRGCGKIYTEQPQLSYLDKYTLGYKGSYPDCDYSEQVADSYGAYVRYVFGNINECQVILDKSDSEGLFAITVSYNEYYGPDFGKGDIDG